MPFTPSTNAAAIVTQIGANMAAAGQSALQTSVTGGNTAPGAFVDGLLSGIGYQAQSDAGALGSASQSSSTYATVGNGATTGFSAWSITVPLTKTYLLRVDLSCFASTAGGLLSFGTMVDGSPMARLKTQQLFFNVANQHMRMSWCQPLALTAGARSVVLQWSVVSPVVANVDASDFRCFTLTG